MINNKLKEELANQGITGYRLAKDCNLAVTTVYNIINGKAYPYPGWRKKISSYLNIPEGDLFALEKEDSK